MTSQHASLLCALSYPDRIARCEELLRGDLSAVERAEIGYFLAHALYQEDRVTDALRACTDALPGAAGLHASMLLGCRAMALLDLGQVRPAESAVGQAAAQINEDSLKATALRAQLSMILGLAQVARRQSGSPYFRQALNLYEGLEQDFGASWALVNLASEALREGALKNAVEYLEQVTSQRHLVTAKLLLAECRFRQGFHGSAEGLLEEIKGGYHGDLRHQDWARVHYLKALQHLNDGQLVLASAAVNQALDELYQEQRRELDLLAQIHELRGRLGNERGVA